MLIDTAREACIPRHRERRIEQVAVGREHGRDRAGIRKRRVEDVDLLLMQAVHPRHLFERALVHPVVEDSGAPSKRRPAALERRPGEADPRADVVVVVEMRLHFVPHARAEREVLPYADVVLHVDGGHQVQRVDRRVADAPRVARRPSGLERLEAVEGVRAEVVRVHVGMHALCLGIDPDPDRVHSADVVEIGLQIEELRQPAA